MKKLVNNITSIDAFLIISLTITGLFFLINIITHGAIFGQAIQYSYELEAADFFSAEAFAAGIGNVYYIDPVNACYPPLAYCFLWLIYRIAPAFVTDHHDYEALMNTDNQLTLYVMFNLIMVVLLVYGIVQFFKKTEFKYLVLLPTAILCSYPFYGTTIQRGNIICYPAAFMIIAYAWLDDDSKIKRELSSVLIAISASFKLVPAVAGLSILKRKDIKRVIRLVVYGILIFVIPFIFTGGFSEILHYITNMSIRSEREIAIGSVKGMTVFLLGLLAKRVPAISIDFIEGVGTLFQILFLIVSVLMTMLAKRKHHEILFATGIMACFLPVNFPYVLVYIVPALFMFIKETTKPNGITEWITLVCYAIIFSIPFFFAMLPWGVEAMSFVMVYILLFVNIISEILDIRKASL